MSATAALAAAGAPRAEREARLTLSRLCEPGDLRVASLAAELGVVRLLELLLEDEDVGGMLRDVSGRLEVTDADRELEVASRRGFRWVVPGDEEWPEPVDDLGSCEPLQRMGLAPLGLWVRGPVRLHELTAPVAIVGSRSATTYGTDVAFDLGSGLAGAGSAVVSGAAIGIDQAAHRGAIAAGGVTVAVLACGVDRAYPAAHQELLDHIASHGAVVSEVAPGSAPMRPRFLARNRVIAALSRGTVVVEAAVRSGALNTASWSSRLMRPLMGVPGPVTSASSQGVHELVRSGAATLVTQADDVLELVAPAGERLAEPRRARERPRDRLDRRQQQVLEAVPVASCAPVDSVARTAGLGVVEVRSTLAVLSRRGLVEQLPTGWRLTPAALGEEVADES